ncbi:DgyrCDS7402 [Dimorphilus gyrociliatus]|uniref:DgyrCDS7402 n=1 Tax=Dimorphilus gyrociliatus TaxID=2664684 RepID=A0A7I8VQX5_9ANNE|nr:DgyrCDS7402 [Dimorphilus gyrociliatus]
MADDQPIAIQLIDEGAELSPGNGGQGGIGGPGYAIPKENSRNDVDSDSSSQSSPQRNTNNTLGKKEGSSGRKALEIKIRELNKDKEESKRSIMILEGRLKEAEAYRERIFKREEEREEQEGLASQELAKVKHLLINAQTERDSALKKLDDEKEISATRGLKLENLQKVIENSRSTNPPDVNALHEEKDSLVNEILELKKEHSFKIEQLHKTVENLEEKLKNEEKSNAELKDKLATSVTNSNSEKSKIEITKREYEKEITYLKKEITAFNSEKINIQAEKDRIEKNAEDLSEKFNKLQEELNHVTAQWIPMREAKFKKSKQFEVDLKQELATQTERNDNLCQEIIKLTKQLASVESNLADRSKTVKLQQQRLNEMKKTLQKELRVQPLPMDSTRSFPTLPQIPATIDVNLSDFIPPIPKDNGVTCSKCDHLNYEYLRHVVIKFMLSRESEAIHLIKAVSVLLHLTADEQKLIKDTLEYKMSWFGSPPSLPSKGQKAKVVPRTF